MHMHSGTWMKLIAFLMSDWLMRPHVFFVFVFFLTYPPINLSSKLLFIFSFLFVHSDERKIIKHFITLIIILLLFRYFYLHLTPGMHMLYSTRGYTA